MGYAGVSSRMLHYAKLTSSRGVLKCAAASPELHHILTNETEMYCTLRVCLLNTERLIHQTEPDVEHIWRPQRPKPTGLDSCERPCERDPHSCRTRLTSYCLICTQRS